MLTLEAANNSYKQQLVPDHVRFTNVLSHLIQFVTNDFAFAANQNWTLTGSGIA